MTNSFSSALTFNCLCYPLCIPVLESLLKVMVSTIKMRVKAIANGFVFLATDAYLAR